MLHLVLQILKILASIGAMKQASIGAMNVGFIEETVQ